MSRSQRPGAVAIAAVLLVGAVTGQGGPPQEATFSQASSYERFMGRWSRAVAPLLVRFAGVQDGEALLDVGSGTGALTASLAEAAPLGRIVGIDPSAPYVDFARRTQGAARVTFEIGDAQQMRFEDGAFDRSLSLLVLNFVPDPASAVDEMKRVTRRRGIVAAAVWDYAEGMEMLRAFWDEAIALAPANAAKDQRHAAFARRGELGSLWRARGFRDVVEEPLTIETPFASFDDYWSPFLDQQGSTGAYLATRPAVERAALETRLRRRLLGDGPDRPFTLKARVWAVRGVVP